MPSLTVMEINEPAANESLPIMPNEEASDKPSVTMETDPKKPTSDGDKTPQTRRGRPRKKSRNVSPSTPNKEKSAEKGSCSSGGSKQKKLKNQPTLASFFGAKKAVSPSPRLAGTKRKATTEIAAKNPTKETPEVANESGDDKPSPDEVTVQPKNIFSTVGSKASLSASTFDGSGAKNRVEKDEASALPAAVTSPAQTEEHDEVVTPTGVDSSEDKAADENDGCPASSDSQTKLPPPPEPADNAVETVEPKKEKGTSATDDIKVESESGKDIEAALTDEQKQLLQKNQEMTKRYSSRASALVSDARSGLEEEDFEMPPLDSLPEDIPADQDYPDTVVANMALLIEGSPLPLTKLVENVRQRLEDRHSRKWSAESIDAKIKILAKRRPVFNIQPVTANLNLFENEDEDRMWRWEVITIEILPTDVVSKVRKARAARKKLSSNHAALVKLLQTLQNAEPSIRDPKLKSLDKVTAKISLDEEKVLKFEREAEKKRLAEQAKRKKLEELEAKRKEKEKMAEEKRKEKELKKQEAEKKKIELETKKQEQAEAREAAKRQKIEAKERQEEERQRAEEQKKLNLNKQKKCLMSFFAAPKPTEPKQVESQKHADSKSGADRGEGTQSSEKEFDVDTFRSQINSFDSHAAIPQSAKDPPAEAIASRKRKTRKVDVSVYVTVIPDENNPFDAQPFAELKTLRVPNKYRFLSFREDTRPPYHGTWSKKSFVVSGRRPFAKDTNQLDYDYDSEAEWEEGDDEMGEDVEDEARNQEEEMEEGNDRIYDYDDGFCVADDQYLDTDENVDEEDKELYKKKLAVTKDGDAPIAVVNKIRVIAPLQGGLPCTEDLTGSKNCFEGFEKNEGKKFLSSFRGEILSDQFLCLDAFPPPLNDEGEPKMDKSAPSSSPANSSDDYTKEEMITLARFVHLSTLNSKEKIIEELRNEHLASFGSRAKAIRKLDSIATKKRWANATGVYWEVKNAILEELGLKDLVKQLEEKVAADVAAKKTKSAADKKSSEPVAKKKKGKKRASLDSLASISPPEKKSKTEKKSKVEKKLKTDESVESKKEKKPPAMAASANLLANFLIRPKKPKKEAPAPA